jgi:thiamine biosynthesis lipoprotein
LGIETIRKYPLFGTTAELVLFDVEESAAHLILDDAYSLGQKLQKTFDFHDKYSELSGLNKRRLLKASPELIKVLAIALKYSRLSAGQYDITHGKQFIERKKGLQISDLACSYKDVQINGTKVTLLHPDVLIDLGSIAKGYIADELVKFIKKAGVKSGSVDARGDIISFGKEQIVGVQHPRKDLLFCQIKAKDSGIATSGDYRQFNKSFDQSHILNNKEMISATVAAPDLMTADLFASLVMVLDRPAREALIRKNPKIKVLTIDKELHAKYYNGFENMVLK